MSDDVINLISDGETSDESTDGSPGSSESHGNRSRNRSRKRSRKAPLRFQPEVFRRRCSDELGGQTRQSEKSILKAQLSDYHIALQKSKLEIEGMQRVLDDSIVCQKNCSVCKESMQEAAVVSCKNNHVTHIACARVLLRTSKDSLVCFCKEPLGILDRYSEFMIGSNDSEVSTVMLDNLREKQEDNLCVICCRRAKNVLFLPCNHVFGCQVCSGGLSLCAICRLPRTGIMEVYIA